MSNMKFYFPISMLALSIALVGCDIKKQDPAGTTIDLTPKVETVTPVEPVVIDPNIQYFADNVEILTAISTALETYKGETGSYPKQSKRKKISRPLAVLADKYATDLPKSTAGPLPGDFYYVSDGQTYSLTAQYSGDCYIARTSARVQIDPELSAGSKDCLSYGLLGSVNPAASIAINPNDFAQNISRLKILQTAIEKYKTDTGQYPISQKEKGISRSLASLSGSYLEKLSSKTKGDPAGRFFYISDGSYYILTARKSGDCYLARNHQDVKIVPNLSAGNQDCMAYGLWSTGAYNK